MGATGCDPEAACVALVVGIAHAAMVEVLEEAAVRGCQVWRCHKGCVDLERPYQHAPASLPLAAYQDADRNHLVAYQGLSHQVRIDLVVEGKQV